METNIAGAMLGSNWTGLNARLLAVMREVMPSTPSAQRLASVVQEANAEVPQFRDRNPKFADSMRGNASLVNKMEVASVIAQRYAAGVVRARRVTQVKSMREAKDSADGEGQQLSLLPVLALLA